MEVFQKGGDFVGEVGLSRGVGRLEVVLNDKSLFKSTIISLAAGRAQLVLDFAIKVGGFFGHCAVPREYT